MAEKFLNGRVELHCGDCLAVLQTLAESGIDACVTDPPYLLTSIVNRFGKNGSAPAQFGKDGRFKRLSGGFMNRKWDTPDVPAIDPGFAYWMAGFIDGEGCFSVHKKKVNGCETYDCQFSMTLRADDKDIVVEMQRQLGGIGSIADRPAPSANAGPQVRYCISSQRDCWRLREVLTVFPLRAKKARDFDIWSHALDAWIAHEPGSSWEDVAYFRDALMAVRRYGADFHPNQLWAYRWAREVYRVLKPGAHLLAFGGTRTYHRLACAIEDAGFEIRDCIMWVYGSGFPKSHDVSKGIDRAAVAEREIVGIRQFADGTSARRTAGSSGVPESGAAGQAFETAPAIDAAREWEGWGTALKPACEMIVLARKPLSEGTVAANVLKWGTGALNIDGCRVAGMPPSVPNITNGRIFEGAKERGEMSKPSLLGRWPANLIHDGSEEVLAGFPEVDTHGGGNSTHGFWSDGANGWQQKQPPGDSGSAARFFYQAKPDNGREGEASAERRYTDEGATNFAALPGARRDAASPSRYFYTAKADDQDRLGSSHPTVKPLDLMQYLCRLVCRRGGTVLDPFAGTGTTGEAAWREGMRAVLIERESEYQDEIRRRMKHAMDGPDMRAAATAKAKEKRSPPEPLPLFAER